VQRQLFDDILITADRDAKHAAPEDEWSLSTADEVDPKVDTPDSDTVEKGVVWNEQQAIGPKSYLCGVANVPACAPLYRSARTGSARLENAIRCLPADIRVEILKAKEPARDDRCSEAAVRARSAGRSSLP
jgi:hypothetical protein